VKTARARKPETSTHDALLSIDQTAQFLGMSPWVVRDMVRYGKLAAVKVGPGHNAAVRIRRSDIDALLVPVVPKPMRRPRFQSASSNGESRSSGEEDRDPAVAATELDDRSVTQPGDDDGPSR
jgi:excisionase family DNA binding protein